MTNATTTTTTTAPPARRRRTRARSTARTIARAVLLLLVLLAVVGPMLVPPPAIDLAHDLGPPRGAFDLGHGEGGTSVLASLLWGTRGAVVVGVAVSALATAWALLVALVAALGGPRVRALVRRVMDLMLAFPSLLLAAALSAVVAPSTLGVVLVLTVSSWAAPARVLSGLADAIVGRDHVTAAVALGASRARIAWRHVLPLLSQAVWVQLTQAFGGAIVAEASLAFLGLSAPPLSPPMYASWGGMLDDGVALLFAAPHLWWPPALAVLLVAAAAQVAVMDADR